MANVTMDSLSRSRIQHGGAKIVPDARKLLWILATFNWTAFLVYSRNAPLDYMAFYTAGKFVVSGDAGNLFNLARQASFQEAILGKPGTLPFYHLAYESLIFAPLSLPSFRVSLWLWRAALAMLILGIGAALTQTFQLKKADVYTIVLSFMSTALAFAQGQDSLLLMWCLANGFLLLLRNEDLLAGVTLSLAIFKPQLVFPIAVLIGWKRGKRFASGFIMGSACMLLVSTAVSGRQGWVEWLRVVAKASSGGGKEIGATSQFMANGRGFISLIVHDARTVLILCSVLAVGLFAFTLWRLRDCDDPRVYVPVAVVLAVIISYHLNIHDLVLLLIPLASLIASDEREIHVQLTIGLCYALPLFLIFNVIPWFFLVTLLLWLHFISSKPINAPRETFT